jgi:hypothetical protein
MKSAGLADSLRLQKRHDAAGLVALTPVARRQSVHEIAFHLIDLIGADLGEAFIEWLCPEPRGRVALIMPVLLKPLRERDGAVAVESVEGDDDFGGGTTSAGRLVMLGLP